MDFLSSLSQPRRRHRKRAGSGARRDGFAEVAAIDPCNRMAPEGGVAHSLAEMVIDGLVRSIELNGYWFSGWRLSFLSSRYLTDEL